MRNASLQGAEYCIQTKHIRANMKRININTICDNYKKTNINTESVSYIRANMKRSNINTDSVSYIRANMKRSNINTDSAVTGVTAHLSRANNITRFFDVNICWNVCA